MKNLIAYASICILSASASAYVSPGDLGRTLTTPAREVRDGIYQLERDAKLKPLSFETLGESGGDLAEAEITIPAKQPFAVKVDGDRAIVTPLIADEAVGATPDLYEFKLADLNALAPKFLSSGDTALMYQTFSPDAVTAIAGRCKWYVERHLGFHVEGACASSMTAHKLARVGFHPTSCERAQLKVWGGGRRGCGHVAYRTQGGGWSSTDYVGDPGSNYYATGCYSRR